MATRRTATFCGHRTVSTASGVERITYNSCRNRHCPEYQRVATEPWLAARGRDVLAIPYFLSPGYNGLRPGDLHVTGSLAALAEPAVFAA